MSSLSSEIFLYTIVFFWISLPLSITTQERLDGSLSRILALKIFPTGKSFFIPHLSLSTIFQTLTHLVLPPIDPLCKTYASTALVTKEMMLRSQICRFIKLCYLTGNDAQESNMQIHKTVSSNAIESLKERENPIEREEGQDQEIGEAIVEPSTANPGDYKKGSSTILRV
ncbi:uncharacterized protein LOC143881737 isoform X1 [Tasmannia lanceolata]|uniref:uncharacterized protein LOC143881737 isoform X1 n=2 Tax=Tasmannia lanceolata TaxID=3420 RepID=UPI00406493C9